jgi:hypothetical protein
MADIHEASVRVRGPDKLEVALEKLAELESRLRELEEIVREITAVVKEAQRKKSGRVRP